MGVMEILSKAVEADVEAGSALIDNVVYDFMCDLVEVNKADLQQLYGMWALDRVQVAKKALARGYVESVSKGAYPSDDVQRAAEWLNGIEQFVVAATKGDVSKSSFETWLIGNKRVNRQVSRDAQGRFTRGINQEKSRSVSPNSDDKDIAPALRPFADRAKNTWGAGIDTAQAEKHQYQYGEAIRAAQELKSGLGGKSNGADIVLLVQDRDGEVQRLRGSLNNVKDGDLGIKVDPKAAILGVEVAPSQNAQAADVQRIAEFNMLGGAGGVALAQLANTSPELRRNLANALSMPNAAEDKSGLTRLFDVLGAGGAVLAGVPGGEKVGQMAALVGTMGPQAEQVLGPYVKRSAYRYRGTEKTPDRELRDPQAALNAEQVARIATEFAGSSGESLRMHATADAASTILAETLPKDPIVAQLSEASGQVLPSQGVIYDANGKLVSQSVGFTDDHYLPFDLTNLGRLRGGQYVRTRQQGGMTGEDIYTLVMSGARQAQVVSSSGVFTIEMAPDFRGARAMSDKARSMYTNYLKILDAVEASNLYLEDIPPQKKAELYTQAREMLGEDATDKEVRGVANQLIERERIKAQGITTDDEEAAAVRALRTMGVSQGDMTALERAQGLPGVERRQFAGLYEDNIEEIRSTKANKLRLNGEGYSVALKTLQEQFPYFIQDVKYRRLNELPTDDLREMPKTRAYTLDQGYARPGSLRAKNVQTGFYNPGQTEPGEKPQYGQTRAERATESPAAVEETPQAPAAETAAPQAAPAQKAPSTGLQAELDGNQTLGQKYRTAAEGFAKETMTIPMTAKAGSSGATLPIDSFSGDKAGLVEWAFSQTKASNVADALAGQYGAQLATALADPDAVRQGLDRLLAADNRDLPEFLAESTIMGSNNADDVVERVTEAGSRLSDLVAMQQGFAKSPPRDKIADHRGLMPIQFPGISDITDGEKLKAFLSDPKNAELAEYARMLSLDGNKSRPLSEISDMAAERLDGIAQVTEARKARQAAVQAKSSNADKPVSNYLDETAWRQATGSSALPSMDVLVNFNRDGELGMLTQQAWALAATTRIIDELEGGGAGPKVGTQLLAEVRKASRRPLVSATGRPLVL